MERMVATPIANIPIGQGTFDMGQLLSVVGARWEVRVEWRRQGPSSYRSIHPTVFPFSSDPEHPSPPAHSREASPVAVATKKPQVCLILFSFTFPGPDQGREIRRSPRSRGEAKRQNTLRASFFHPPGLARAPPSCNKNSETEQPREQDPRSPVSSGYRRSGLLRDVGPMSLPSSFVSIDR